MHEINNDVTCADHASCIFTMPEITDARCGSCDSESNADHSDPTQQYQRVSRPSKRSADEEAHADADTLGVPPHFASNHVPPSSSMGGGLATAPTDVCDGLCRPGKGAAQASHAGSHRTSSSDCDAGCRAAVAKGDASDVPDVAVSSATCGYDALPDADAVTIAFNDAVRKLKRLRASGA